MQEIVVLAAIGNPEAKTYGSSFAYMALLMIAIALGFLIIMIGVRDRSVYRVQSSYLSRTDSSNWIATRLFLAGWAIAVLCAYLIVAILPYLVWYATQEKNDYSFHWCYECNGWTFSLGPELSIAASAVSLAGLAIGIAMVTKGRRPANPGSQSPYKHFS